MTLHGSATYFDFKLIAEGYPRGTQADLEITFLRLLEVYPSKQQIIPLSVLVL